MGVVVKVVWFYFMGVIVGVYEIGMIEWIVFIGCGKIVGCLFVVLYGGMFVLVDSFCYIWCDDFVDF